ncbi:peptidylprolyl isomerase [Celeribacter marinus]|uniref:Parvulin-like PPIase n=1 Tax=Celeribacter marinus TaxID=1397108 RepID=A0A0N9ZJ59_9RHOB|nr:peptidylprolyl isomerase [Celeribacter marinus]ALI55761.1 peptidyl-prolyl cis-trans isomerase PpiC [Celeribacter marinus]SFL05340.1 peptidyl-prolyl cis-trans isomerase C [Celeribacter marinus]
MKYRRFIAALVISQAALTATPLFAQEISADTVVATVNGSSITMGNVIAARGTLPEQYQTLPVDELFTGILEQMIQQEVLRQSIGEPNKALQIQMQNETRAIFAGAALEEMAERAMTDEAIEAFYNETYASAEPSREYRAAHILVETEDEAKALLVDLDGGVDFADLARQKSTGPSGPNGGDLGWFGKGMMVAPFEEAVAAMEEGAVSAPVQTQFGWHIIKLVETRLQDIPSLDDMREEIEAQLADVALREGVERLTNDATIERIELDVKDAVNDDTLLAD